MVSPPFGDVAEPPTVCGNTLRPLIRGLSLYHRCHALSIFAFCSVRAPAAGRNAPPGEASALLVSYVLSFCIVSFCFRCLCGTPGCQKCGALRLMLQPQLRLLRFPFLPESGCLSPVFGFVLRAAPGMFFIRYDAPAPQCAYGTAMHVLVKPQITAKSSAHVVLTFLLLLVCIPACRRGYRSLKPPLCKGRWHGVAVTEGLLPGCDDRQSSSQLR